MSDMVVVTREDPATISITKGLGQMIWLTLAQATEWQQQLDVAIKTRMVLRRSCNGAFWESEESAVCEEASA